MEDSQFNPAISSEQNVSPQFSEETPQNQSKLPLITSIIIVAICLIGGSVFAYYEFISPSLSAEEIFQKSLYVSQNVKSFSFDATNSGQIKIDANDGIPALSDFLVLSNGSIDFSSLEDPSVKLNFLIDVSSDSATSSGSIDLDLETLYAQKNLYLSLKDFKVSYNSSSNSDIMGISIFIGMANGIANSLKNKWIQIKPVEIAEADLPKNFLDEDNKKEWQDYLLSMVYVKTIDKIGEEILDGIKTHHLKVSIQHDSELSDFTERDEFENVLLGDDERSNKQQEDLLKTINQKIDFDLWIGKDDYLVYKIATSPITILDSVSGFEFIANQEILFSNYNEPVFVSVPEETLSLEQIMQDLFSGSIEIQ